MKLLGKYCKSTDKLQGRYLGYTGKELGTYRKSIEECLEKFL